ncbi:signal recognition particle-docking protein FtsY [Methanobacterium sp. BAmetb5]|uniref:signal recognition particle-docking protein FtsY n=1 Tax=Methanobacterium sp. BAmetb5 TaxID=2025351 RepID=UPI000E8CADBA|nr:signal recognition particle-docking protein FtsY [Methanobacterium sp. BAmetb5]AXV40736.1 MAG: signal recognition particle-docking protein FtsY [Methanobacterium sp. BAmetb5]
MFESLKKKFSGTIGKISEQLSSEEEEAKKKELKAETNSTPEEVGKKEVTSPKTEKKEDKTSGKDEEEVDSGKEKVEEDEKKSRFSFFRRKSEPEDEDSEGIDKRDKEDSKLKTEFSSDEAATVSSKDQESDTDKESEKEGEEEPSGLFTFATHKTISEKDIDDILFELELALLEGDVAMEVAEQIINSVKGDLVGRKIKRRGDVAQFTRDALKKAISDILVVDGPNLNEMVQQAKKTGEPLKIMFVGVNGTGKTTTISKIADHYVKSGYTPVIAASDTFRAGAIEQISHHAENVGVKIIRHQKGADPAAVAYDAVEHARAQNKELVLIDTAGRMQTNVNLMDEMKKIQRVVKPDLAIFVGDALTGNDAVEQARKFDEAVGVDGIILTKADADAKGGAALSIGHVINKPILFLGVGQGYGDIMEFHPEWMVEQVLGD